MNDFWISEYLYWGGYYHLPSGKLTVFYWKWPSRNSWFTHKKMWCSIVFCERLPECMIHWLNQFHPMVSRRIFIYFHGEVLMKKHIFLHGKTMVKPIIQACAPQADVCWFIHHSKYRYYIYIYYLYVWYIYHNMWPPTLNANQKNHDNPCFFLLFIMIFP
jgi:hypothetical protein